jgi:hypothetical protein
MTTPSQAAREWADKEQESAFSCCEACGGKFLYETRKHSEHAFEAGYARCQSAMLYALKTYNPEIDEWIIPKLGQSELSTIADWLEQRMVREK